MSKKGNDTIPLIVDLNTLGSTESTSSQYFGVKATSLTTSKSLLKWIPNGFALSKEIVTRISLSLASDRELKELNQKFSSLSENGVQKLIVRSSSTLEWLNGNSFAGLYSSVRGILNFEELIAAIRTTYKSSQNTSFQCYAELRGIVLPEEHLGILVQLEIPVTHSALVVIDQNKDFIE